jgi:hypothetical protein
MLFHKLSGYKRMGCSRIKKHRSGSKFNKELTEYDSRSLLGLLSIDVVDSCSALVLGLALLTVGGRCLGGRCRGNLGAVHQVGVGGSGLKGKCAFGPFLSILVIKCQPKCLSVNLCPWMNKVQITSKGMFLSLSTLVLYTNIFV